jgi:myo-inositol-1(or 4)-monophosphatase
MMTWSEELKVAREAVSKAEAIQLDYFGKLSQVSEKGAEGLVSEADSDSEAAIIETIRSKFKSDTFLGEESGLSSANGDRRWIIDPLDGTTNYVHGFPYFCISIALEVEKEVVLGVVHAPLLKTTFHAVRGAGAFKDNHPIRVSQRQTLADCLLATGFSYLKEPELDHLVKLFQKFLHTTRGIRRPGAAALDLAYTAAGVFDGFWEKGLKPWDIAAGSLLVSEAGGKVSNFDGTNFFLESGSILASSVKIWEELYLQIHQSPQS